MVLAKATLKDAVNEWESKRKVGTITKEFAAFDCTPQSMVSLKGVLNGVKAEALDDSMRVRANEMYTTIMSSAPILTFWTTEENTAALAVAKSLSLVVLPAAERDCAAAEQLRKASVEVKVHGEDALQLGDDADARAANKSADSVLRRLPGARTKLATYLKKRPVGFDALVKSSTDLLAEVGALENQITGRILAIVMESIEQESEAIRVFLEDTGNVTKWVAKTVKVTDSEAVKTVYDKTIKDLDSGSLEQSCIACKKVSMRVLHAA